MCVKKLACASYALLKLRAFSPISTFRTVYYALVHPHLSYGLAFCSNATKTSFKKIIILQNKIVRLMTHSDQCTPASGLYKSLQILALDNMIRLTSITIAHSFHHKTLLKNFENLFAYLKTSHSNNTRIVHLPFRIITCRFLLAIVSRTWDLVCINLSFASRDFVCARSTVSAYHCVRANNLDFAFLHWNLSAWTPRFRESSCVSPAHGPRWLFLLSRHRKAISGAANQRLL